MYNKAVDNFLHALEFVPERYKTQKMCDKAVSSFPSTTEFVPECFMTQGMCDTIVSEIPLLIICCSDWYKTQKMSCKAVDDSLATLKLVIRFFYCFIGRWKYI